MFLRPTTATCIAQVLIPICALVAAGVAYAADCLLREAFPNTSSKRGLVVGIMATCGMMLFGILVGEVNRIATRISSLPAGPDALPSHAISRDASM